MSRFVYTVQFGRIPDGLLVRHKCDNPACINPDHLELGTPAENAEDASKRNRLGKRATERTSRLQENEVIEIFKSKERLKVLAQRFRVSIDTIKDIRYKRTWVSLTSSL